MVGIESSTEEESNNSVLEFMRLRVGGREKRKEER